MIISKMPSRDFSFFRLFKQTFLQKINVENFPSSIQCCDLNLQPLEHEYPPITTRPGLAPIQSYLTGQFSENERSTQIFKVHVEDTEALDLAKDVDGARLEEECAPDVEHRIDVVQHQQLLRVVVVLRHLGTSI